MSVSEHRRRLLELMEENSLAIVYAGRPTLANEDEYLPFAVNSTFFYLTDSSRAGQILLLAKCGGKEQELLFIEPADALTERWTGHMPRTEEMQALTGIEQVLMTTEFDSTISRYMSRYPIETVWCDVFRADVNDLPTWNAVRAQELQARYPVLRLRDLHSLAGQLRERKDEEEQERIRRAVSITEKGLAALLTRLKPGMMEYQAQAIFEGVCRYEGAKALAFPTIAAGGANACSMHYDSNAEPLETGSLALFDLGAKYGNYCSDVTRTYPVSGVFSPRQREIYNLVLKANRAVAELAAPGVTFGELEELTCSVLGQGLVELGLLERAEDVRKYYVHSVSHSIGIDAHDVNLRNVPLEAGWVISDEPGLYIDEESIGIRIEDDLLITEDGCEVLSQAIPKDPDEIERIMAQTAGRK